MQILVVGEIGHWLDTGRELPRIAALSFCEFDSVTAELLGQLKPDVVLSPLLASNFDALDLAQVLYNLHFQGRYRAVAPLLPNPELVIREVSALCPGLDFDLQEIPNGPPGPRLY